MSAPTVPTVPTLLTEAYGRCGIASPTQAQLTRAEDEWFEEVKRDIASRKKWHTTEETMVVIPQAYIQVYAMPSPLIRVLRVRFYRGDVKGTATAGDVDSITIPNATADMKGRKIFLLDGTGEGQVGRIIAVNTGTGELTISCSWATDPDNTTVYMVAHSEVEVCGPDKGFTMTGISPSTTIKAWDFIESNLRFWPALDDAGEYALEVDGEVDISLVDRDDARLVRLLREWREPLVRGVVVLIKEDQDEDLQTLAKYENRYERAIINVMKQDTRKRQRADAPALKSAGGTVRHR